MDNYQARTIWDRYVNQGPREFLGFSANYKAFKDGRLSAHRAITEDVNEYVGQLDAMFPGEEISEADGDELREAMRTILGIVYRDSMTWREALERLRELVGDDARYEDGASTWDVANLIESLGEEAGSVGRYHVDEDGITTLDDHGVIRRPYLLRRA